MVFVVDDPRVAAVFTDSLAVGVAHVHAYFHDGVRVSVVRLEILGKAIDHAGVLARCAEEHAPSDQIGKHAQIMMAFAHGHFIHPHADHLRIILLGAGFLNMGFDQPPQARVRLADQTSQPRDGHFAGQQQNVSFKGAREMFGKSFPGRGHALDGLARSAAGPR